MHWLYTELFFLLCSQLSFFSINVELATYSYVDDADPYFGSCLCVVCTFRSLEQSKTATCVWRKGEGAWADPMTCIKGVGMRIWEGFKARDNSSKGLKMARQYWIKSTQQKRTSVGSAAVGCLGQTGHWWPSGSKEMDGWLPLTVGCEQWGAACNLALPCQREGG